MLVGLCSQVVVLIAAVLAMSVGSIALASAPDFLTFESDQVRPLALSRDGRHLYAVNTPDARLEIFDLSRPGLRLVESVPVGMEPVAVAAHPTRAEVWVVNQLSDSVSIVDVSRRPARVVRTLQVGDEPRDVVFAGRRSQRAFITTAHRGQHTLDPTGGYRVSGQGRADVWVFDVRAPHAPVSVVTLFGDKPRPLAVSPDGGTVYVGIHRSGNRTAAVKNHFVCGRLPDAEPCSWDGESFFPGGLPAPAENHEGILTPGGGLIVAYDPTSGEWRDERGWDWSNAIPFDLPDLDVFALDADAPRPVELRSWASVGTILYGMAVNPVSGHIYVTNTDARNEVRFEGPGIRARGQKPEGEPLTVVGHLHEARITVIDREGVKPRHLNKHIDYDVSPAPPGVSERSLSIPTGMAVSSDGERLYLAAFGSSKIGVFDVAELEDDRFQPDARHHIELDAGGPSGLALDERRQRLYVLTRFDNAVVAVDLRTRRQVARVPLHNPEPESVLAGRRFFYDARHTSSNGEASCAVCHVFGDMDDLAWDLGNPDGDSKRNTGPKLRQVPLAEKDFHPMKGPMTTQSMRGLAGHGPLHWRGDRSGIFADPPTDSLDVEAAFKTFNVAFEGLLGRDEPLDEDEMQAFTDFALQITYPPNPIRRLDNSLRPNEQRGSDIFFEREGVFVPGETCNDCHRIDREAGLFGTLGVHDGFVIIKIPHLRNMYQKVGMFGMSFNPLNRGPQFGYTGPQVRGFGFSHDGTEDSVARQIAGLGFSLTEEVDRLDVEAFLMAGPTNLAPVVGQQVSVSGPRDSEGLAVVELLIERASTPFHWPELPGARECDLVAHAVMDGEPRGWLFDAGRFVGDRAFDPALSLDELLALASARPPVRWLGRRWQRAGHPGGWENPVTFTCGPPGTGRRMALDRDRDGVLDGDERVRRFERARPVSTLEAEESPTSAMACGLGFELALLLPVLLRWRSRATSS